MISISMVEVCDTFTRKLQMLLLVMPNGHMGSSYNKKYQFTARYDIQGQWCQGGRIWKDTAGLTGERECQRPGGLDRRIGPASVGNQRGLRPGLKTNPS